MESHEMIRIDKYLSDCGFGTRKEIEKMLKREEVLVDGKRITSHSFKFDENATVLVNGEQVQYQRYIYIMLNKPAGYISATEGNDPTVLDLIQEPFKNLFPCGRLDKDTEGLLLITNDGPLAHNLLSPKKHVEKEYLVVVDYELTDEQLQLFEKGMQLDDFVCQPAKIWKSDDKKYHIVIREGKFHQIKRMFEAVGSHVLYLKRLRMKNLILDETLELGSYRFLNEDEIKDLKG